MLLELIRHGRPPTVVFAASSVPPTYANDALVAGRVAEDLGVRHICWTPRPEDVADELDKNLTTGLCTDEHGWFPGVRRGLSLLTDAYYDGIGGDVLSASQFLPTPVGRGILAGDPAAVMRNLAVLPEPVLADILTVDGYKRLSFDRAVERLRTELRRHAETPNPVASFFFFNRTRREVALLPFRLAAAAFPTVFTPFLDHGLVMWLLGLPSELSIGGKLHDDAIRTANPVAAEWPIASAAAEAPKPAEGLTASTLRYVTARPDGPLVRRNRLADHLSTAAARGERPWWVGLALLLLQIEDEATRSP